MRVFLFILVFLPFYLLTITVQAAPALIHPVDVPRHPTAQAVVTIGQPNGAVTAMHFAEVPDLQSCFNLAWTAAEKGHRESTATCLNERNKVIESYYCAPAGDNQPFCRTIAP